jgi:hypothetical protein
MRRLQGLLDTLTDTAEGIATRSMATASTSRASLENTMLPSYEASEERSRAEQMVSELVGEEETFDSVSRDDEILRQVSSAQEDRFSLSVEERMDLDPNNYLSIL